MQIKVKFNKLGKIYLQIIIESKKTPFHRQKFGSFTIGKMRFTSSFFLRFNVLYI